MLTRGVQAAVVAFMVIVGSSCPPAMAGTIIKVASVATPQQNMWKMVEKFKGLVESRSSGALQLHLFPSGAMGGEKEMVEAVGMGGLQMAASTLSPVDMFAPSYAFANAPFVVRDWDHFVRIWNGKLGTQMKEATAQKGNLMMLAPYFIGGRHLATKVAAMKPSDIKGLKLRLPTLSSWIAIWKGVGASPVPIAWPETYMAIQMGVADALENDLNGLLVNHFYQVAPYLNLTGHMQLACVMTINKDFFNRLSKEHQTIVVEAEKEAADWVSKYVQGAEQQTIAELVAKGMKRVDSDQRAFFGAARPAVENLFKTEWNVTTWDELNSY